MGASKKPSGAQNRKRRREQARAESTAQQALVGSPDGDAVLAEWTERYRELGPPPADTVGRVEWANEICALVIYETLAAPAIRASAERKLILEGVRTLGMTAVKALYESRLLKLEAKVYGKRRQKGDHAGEDGLEDLPSD